MTLRTREMLVRKLKGQLDLQHQVSLPVFGRYAVVIGVDAQLQRLATELKALRKPLPSGRVHLPPLANPVRYNLRRPVNRLSVGKMVIDDRVQKQFRHAPETLHRRLAQHLGRSRERR